MKSCEKLHEELTSETQLACTMDLFEAFQDALSTAVGIILMLYIRNRHLTTPYGGEGCEDRTDEWHLETELDKEDHLESAKVQTQGKENTELNDYQVTTETERQLSQQLLVKLLAKFPQITCPDTGITVPTGHVLMTNEYHIVSIALPCNYNMLQLLIHAGFDIYENDSDGNTLLHAIIKSVIKLLKVMHERDRYDADYALYDYELRLEMKPAIALTLKFLLERGMYLHARNNGRKTIMDIIQDCLNEGFFGEAADSEDENSGHDVLQHIRDVLKKYEEFSTLKHLAAKAIKDFALPYENMLPTSLTKFVDYH